MLPLHTKKQHKRDTEEYQRQWLVWSMGRGPHPITGKWKSKPSKPPAFKFIPCYWCNTPTRSDANACGECGQPVDLKRSQEAENRSKKTYLDIVRDNARRAGKDPKVEVRRAKLATKHILFGEKTNRELLNKLGEYLESKRGDRQLTGWDAARKKLKQRSCQMCLNEYKPKAFNQKFCAVCQVERGKQITRAYWHRKHPNAQPKGRPKKTAATV
jgi:hypothetical protein